MKIIEKETVVKKTVTSITLQLTAKEARVLRTICTLDTRIPLLLENRGDRMSGLARDLIYELQTILDKEGLHSVTNDVKDWDSISCS